MEHLLHRFHIVFFSWRSIFTEEMLAIFFVFFVLAVPAGAAAMRFQERSLYINNATPGSVASYTVSFRYMSQANIGSVDMLFCVSPIPYEPCVTPPGLDASQATLGAQTGETGFAISSKSTNHIVLSRVPGMIPPNGSPSSYRLDGIVNPTDTSEAYSIRLRSHTTTNATGTQIDFGSVRTQVTTPVMLETQVPPMLIFCLAEQVDDNCNGTNNNFYSDMGDLNDSSTLTAQSQMAIGTNASGGFAITAVGLPLTAGTNTIDAPTTPTESKPGSNQFGINLVANNNPGVGSDPEGAWANAITSPDYSIANKYKYVSGDVVAFSPNVSLMKKFTVSYIVNSSKDLRAGVYTTTITYIASGRF